MPPPKKPKIGRTSLEQFMSEEERVPLTGIRDLRDSEGQSPSGSIDTEGSDGEVFLSARSTVAGSDRDVKFSQHPLLDKLLIKPHSIDEQKVPGSPDEDIGSPTTSPTTLEKHADFSAFKLGEFRPRDSSVSKDEPQGFRRYEDIQAERRLSIVEGPDSRNQTVIRNRSESLESANFKMPELSAPENSRLTTEQGRLLDSLVASALATNAAQQIIHSQPSVNETFGGTIPSFMYGHPIRAMPRVPPNAFDTEPHDLSKRTGVDATKLLNHRHYDNLNNNIDRSRSYQDWPARREVTVDRSKPYLDSHRRIAGLLSERDVEKEQRQRRDSAQVLEKENIVQQVPPHHVNGYFHVGLHGGLGDMARFEQRQRDPMERVNIKAEEGNVMMSPGGYLPVHSMMHHTPTTLGQSPTSTTLDLSDPRDRFHPALLNPHLIPPDNRRLKSDSIGSTSSVNKLCQVCSDNASGFHYGVWSCEGCKAFFKRSIQGPVDYVCPATNSCTIDKHRRKSCQACRLRKCYEVGMNKGSQRKDRKSSGPTNGNKLQKRPRSDSDAAVNSTSGGSPTPAKHSRKSRTTMVLEALNKAELPHLESQHNHSLPPTSVNLLNSLIKLAERELVFLINWAKNLPGYTELSLGDQVHLIECCWMELLLLNCAFRSIEHRGRRLAFAPDFLLDRQQWAVMGMSDVFEQVAAVADQMLQYNLHRDEHLLLQATVLANAEVRKLASHSKLHEIQNVVLDSLVDIAQKYHPDCLRHIPSLLLLLTHIRQASDRATTIFQSLKREGTVEFCDLLTEMLDSQNCGSEEDKTTSETVPPPSTPVL